MLNVTSQVETALRALSDAISGQRQLGYQSVDTEYNDAEKTYAERLTTIFNGLVAAQQLYLIGMTNATDQIITQAERDGARA
jgi:hypothetical protein